MRRFALFVLVWHLAFVGVLLFASDLQGGTTAHVEIKGALGYARCDLAWGPVGWVRIDVLQESPEAEAVIAHELDHLKKMASFADCAEFEEWTRDPQNVIELEASGFCQSARVAFRQGRFPTLTAAIDNYATWLERGYPFGLTHEEAVAAIREHCQ